MFTPQTKILYRSGVKDIISDPVMFSKIQRVFGQTRKYDMISNKY